MNQPLVSMITYCYNGERFVAKYFEAILEQTYSNIELFFFNNGSEDRTGEIAESFRESLEKKGIHYYLEHYEKNQLTCFLKEKAFHMMHGEYFFGCDSDDLIYPTYIEEMVTYLQQNPNKGIVYCQADVVEESTNIKERTLKMIPRYNKHECFSDILKGDNIIFTAAAYMMSTKHFDLVNPERKIYQSRFGENYQVQMPFLYHDLQGYIEKPLFQYTVRSDSYSAQLDYQKKFIAFKGQEESVLATLEQIEPENIDFYKKYFLRRIRRDRFYAALSLDDKGKIKESYDELSEVGGVSMRERICYFMTKMGISYNVLRRYKNKV